MKLVKEKSKGGSGKLSRATSVAIGCFALVVLLLLPLPGSRDQAVAVGPPARESREPEDEPTEFAPEGVILGGAPDVFSVAFSPDGKFLAAGLGTNSQPGAIEVFEVPSGKLVHHISEKRGVAALSFAADSKRLAWSGWGGFVRSRDLDTWRDAWALPVPGRNLRVRHSLDGKWLAVASEDRTMQLRRADDGRLVHSFKDDLTDFYCVAFSPDSRIVAAGGGSFAAAKDNRTVIWDVGTKKEHVLEGHTRAVINVAFAPKNALLATASADNTVRVYEGGTYKFLRALTGHGNAVKGLAFSPDGSTLATGSWDKTVRLWDPTTGKELVNLTGHTGMVHDLAISADGNWLVSAGENHALKLWDLKARKEHLTIRKDIGKETNPSSMALAVSRDGKHVAVGDVDGGITVRDADSGKVLRTIRKHDDAVTALAFSPDGKHVASGGPEAFVLVHNVETGKEVRRFDGHESWIYSLAFSPDGKRLASGSFDRTIRLWDASGKEKPIVLTGHRASVRALGFSPDGAWLVSGSGDRLVRVWDLKTNTAKHVLRGHTDAVRGVAVSRDAVFSLGEDGLLKRWGLVEGKELKSVSSSQEGWSLALSPAGGSLVTGGKENSVKIWSPETLSLRQVRYPHPEGTIGAAFGPGARLFTLGKGGVLRRLEAVGGPAKRFEGHTGPVRVVRFSPDGKFVLSCGGWPLGDKTLRLWSIAEGKQVRLFEGQAAQLQAASFTPDGKHVVAGCDEGLVRLWDATSGKLIRQFTGHKGAVVSLSVSKNGKEMLSASSDQTARLWNVGSGECVHVFKGHTNHVRAAAFLPKDEILTGSWDKSVRLWTKTGKVLRIDQHSAAVDGIAVTSDSKRYFVGGGKEAALREVATGQLVRSVSGHLYPVTCVALASDTRGLTSGYDGSIRLWDLETGAELRRYTGHLNWVWGLSVSPDGKHFLSGGGGSGNASKWETGVDFTVRMWRLPS